jgi:threonyl-tRNA synthetase
VRQQYQGVQPSTSSCHFSHCQRLQHIRHRAFLHIPISAHRGLLLIVYEFYNEKFYEDLKAQGIEVLIDDREERAGVKFKDADLIGIPTHVVIGEKNLKEGKVEIKDRKTKEAEKVDIEEIAERIKEMIRE